MRSGGKAASESRRMRSAAAWLGVLAFALCGLFAYSETSPGVLRSRVYKLRHIDSQAAKSLLVRLKIGTEYNTLSKDVLIVTSDRTLDLVKATSVMTVADSETPVEIRPLMVPTDELPAPKPEELAVRLRTLSLGSLVDGPPMGVPNPAVVDVFEGTLIAIGTPETLGAIETAIEAWKKEKAPKEEPKPEETPAPIKETAPASEPNASEPAPAAEPNAVAATVVEAAVQPSLAEVAEQIFEEIKTDAAGLEPNAVQPKADPTQLATEEFLDQSLMDALAEQAKKAEPNEPTEPAKSAESTDAARPVEPIEPIDPNKPAEPADPATETPGTEDAVKPAEGRDGARAMLEMLMKSAQEKKAAQQTPPAAAEATKDDVKAEVKDEVKPSAGEDGGIVTGPTLPAGKAAEELELTMTLPEEVEIEALLELVGKQLGLNYMYNSAVLRGKKVMLKIHDGKIKVGELYSLLESVLRFQGYVMTRRDSLVTIVETKDAGTVDPVLRLPDQPILPGDVVVSSVFELKHASTATAQNMLSQMRLGTGFSAIPETGTLIVTDYAFRMERIREVISMIDVAGAPKDFQFRQLHYMQAAELAPKVKALASQIQGISVTVAASSAVPGAAPGATPAARPVIDPRTGRPMPTQAQPGLPTAQPAGGQAANQETVYLEADDRTNRVLMIGYASELATINQLIDSLDVPGYDLRFVKEYVIQYVEATDVITVLNELGLARVTVGTGQTSQMTASRQPIARPGQQLTPQQIAAQQQQQQQQMAQQQQMGGGGVSINEPYISLRSATNSLLVNATDEQHEAIELVISHVDVMQKDQRTIREYEIQYVDTQSILDTLGDLGIITPQRTETAGSRSAMATGGRMSQQQQQMQQQQMGGVNGEFSAPIALPSADGTEREITAQEPQIAVLASINSLLVHATPRQHAAIALVIAHADRDPTRAFAPYVVYALENQDPEELAEVLTELIQETVEDTTDGARSASAGPSAPDARIQTRSTGVTTLPSGEEERIRIIPDAKTYSLVVYANKRNQQWVGDLIRELDEYRPQVLLDCTLVEITQNEEFRYDLDIIAKTYGGNDLRSGTDLIGSRGPFSSDDFLDARSNSGQGSAFLDTEKVQALLDVVQRKGYGRIMAKPKLLVNDNQEGEIKTENTTSIAQQKSIIQPATGTSPSVTTTDVSFAEYTSGIILTIKPHISKGDMLRLEIGLNRKDFDFTEGREVTVAGQTFPRPPDLLSTDVATVATVPDGTTIILGGLETLNQRKTHTKVPILGDIPLVGGLFRGIENRGNQSRLYVFVTANILRPGDQLGGLEDIRRVSDRDRKAFEAQESRFQNMEDWPGIKAKPMDPDTVLSPNDEN